MQGWTGADTNIQRNTIYSEGEDVVAGRSKASSSGYGSQRGSGGGSEGSRAPQAVPDLGLLPRPIWPHPDFPEDPYNIYSTYSGRPQAYLTRFQRYSFINHAGSSQGEYSSSARSETSKRRSFSGYTTTAYHAITNTQAKNDKLRRERFSDPHGEYLDPKEVYLNKGATTRRDSGSVDTFSSGVDVRGSQILSDKARYSNQKQFESKSDRYRCDDDCSEINFVTKEFDYLTKLSGSSNEGFNEGDGAYVNNDGRNIIVDVKRPSSRAEVSKNICDLDYRDSFKNARINQKLFKVGNDSSNESIEVHKGKEDVNNSEALESNSFFDSLQADPFLLYSHFIAQEEAKARSKGVKPRADKTTAVYEYIEKDENNVRKKRTNVTYDTIADVHDKDQKANKETNKNEEVRLNDEESIEKMLSVIDEEVSNPSLTVEKEDYIRALLQDVAVALEGALSARKVEPQGGLLYEARDRVAMGLVALRRAGPGDLRALSTALAREPARAHAPRLPISRVPSLYSRKPSLWQHYHARAAAARDDDQDSSFFERIRPEAQFTLGQAGQKRLTARLAKSSRAKRNCRFTATALALFFFLAALMGCSLLLSNGRAMFGSMTM